MDSNLGHPLMDGVLVAANEKLQAKKKRIQMLYHCHHSAIQSYKHTTFNHRENNNASSKITALPCLKYLLVNKTPDEQELHESKKDVIVLPKQEEEPKITPCSNQPVLMIM